VKEHELRAGKSQAYEPLGALISETVDVYLVVPHWDEVLRLKASIGHSDHVAQQARHRAKATHVFLL